MSNNNLDQLAAAQKANAEVMMALMRTAFEGMEKLAALNMTASREFFNASVTNAQQLMSAKDAQELAKINSSLSQPNVQKLMDYSRNIYDLVTQLQQEVTQVMDAQYNSFSKKASATIAQTSAQAPVGGDVFAAAMKSMLDATNQAFGNMQNMAKQMTEIADANLQAASTATAKAVSATTPKKK
jgi:phasin family protein